MTTAELIAACRTRLAQMRERESKATPGPWHGYGLVYLEDDKAFIVHARIDLPALLTWAEQELEIMQLYQGPPEDTTAAWSALSLQRLARALGVL